MKRYLLILTIILTVFAVITPVQKAEAIDPVAIAVLSPIAVQTARVVLPVVMRSLASMGKMTVKAGVELINVLRLPIGLVLVMCCRFKSGAKQMLKGSIAPFKMAFYVVMIPVSAVTGAI